MNFQNVKSIYVISCFILGLLILLPTFLAIVPLPEEERFTELWLLDSNHMIQSGSVDVSLYEPYTFYFGVGNQMGDLEYYTIYVKLRSKSQAFQEPGTELPSSLAPVFEHRLFLRNSETWEKNFVFSFEEASFEGNVGRVSMLLIDGNKVSVDTPLVRDGSDGSFHCQVLFELWSYNATISDFQYTNRSVWFWFNLIEL